MNEKGGYTIGFGSFPLVYANARDSFWSKPFTFGGGLGEVLPIQCY